MQEREHWGQMSTLNIGWTNGTSQTSIHSSICIYALLKFRNDAIPFSHSPPDSIVPLGYRHHFSHVQHKPLETMLNRVNILTHYALHRTITCFHPFLPPTTVKSISPALSRSISP